MKKTIVLLPGDGIGPTVLGEAKRVLEAVKFEADYVYADIGLKFWCEEGNPLPQRTLDLLREHRIGLFGAITSKPPREAQAELAPELQGQALEYKSPIVGLRQALGLNFCLRLCQTFKGNPLNFIRRGCDGIEEPEIKVAVVRENQEGLYAGVEWRGLSMELLEFLALISKRTWPEMRDFLEAHPEVKDFVNTFAKAVRARTESPEDEVAFSVCLTTEKFTRKILRAAFEYAKEFGCKSVTLCGKPNVLRKTCGMMLDYARDIAREFPGIQLLKTNIDAQMMWLTKNPEEYEVIVSKNMFGDIASDGFAGLVGGLGFAASANIGDGIAVFEPTHGSAPKYAKLNPPIINPIAAILSAAMMLDYLGEEKKAAQIRKAVAVTVKEGKYQTYDMRFLKGGPDVLRKGACSTREMTDAIIWNL